MLTVDEPLVGLVEGWLDCEATNSHYNCLQQSECCTTYFSGLMTDIQRQQLSHTRYKAFLYQAIFVFCWTPSKPQAPIDLST